MSCMIAGYDNVPESHLSVAILKQLSCIVALAVHLVLHNSKISAPYTTHVHLLAFGMLF